DAVASTLRPDDVVPNAGAGDNLDDEDTNVDIAPALDPAWTALAEEFTAGLKAAEDRAAIKTVLEQVRASGFPKPTRDAMFDVAFERAIAVESDLDEPERLPAAIKAAELSEEIRRRLATLYTNKKAALLAARRRDRTNGTSGTT